ncbi:endonuclease III [Candidatus Roizmanbacteria bacterium CG10_big_fil_rev_8_21_14_0_10_39_6]|uniref:Endonuclease III n=1 Tax=Candidatus Roizmanbacteria bacterium CG10_big_fil_rev_8_21_14_0_10_39_6 TaxID=1974853 RepID=A0A2M8KT51_9BACT|nr:MAG: endonuclease III [Candidatus Roizmanbacteria bacterium CG10_big_fil_rev_8_21_14_0_10_39_6]
MRHSVFQKMILNYYALNGRDLPWRRTQDPYSIMVSEIMLQQTQVERVVVKYTTFLATFPTLSDLAHAALADVLIAWQGLGYNRRAKYLHQTAQVVEKKYGGTIPSSIAHLCDLPGIGYTTACAMMVYAWNNPCAFVETNIRTVFLHHFFSEKLEISDADILKIVTQTVYNENPREWYWALMDYGSMLKREKRVNNSSSKHFTKQSRFIGSNRQIRGAIITFLIKNKKIRFENLHTIFHEDKIRIENIAQKLIKEGLIVLEKRHLLLPKKNI